MIPTPSAIHVLDQHPLAWETRWQVIDRAAEIARDNCRDRVTADDVWSALEEMELHNGGIS